MLNRDVIEQMNRVQIERDSMQKELETLRDKAKSKLYCTYL